nr:MAG TPA: hypothetical protein [Caudoviricetes sp.]
MLRAKRWAMGFPKFVSYRSSWATLALTLS